MSRFLENKMMFAAIFVLFALASALNAVPGAGVALPSHLLLAGNVILADGPILEPDPWDGTVMLADGPILEPDPWDGTVMLADGPILEPDPWDGTVMLADGPILEPDPWDGTLSVTA